MGEIFDESKTPDGLEILKTYARLYLAAGFGPALNEEFTEAGNAFNEAYMGSSGALSLEDSAAQYVQQVILPRGQGGCGENGSGHPGGLPGPD